MPTHPEIVVASEPKPSSKSVRPPSPALPKKLALSAIVIENPAELEPYIPAWDALAAAALEPNVFYESWMLRPALESLSQGSDVVFVLIVAQLPGSPHTPFLCGLFPLERRRHYKGLPVRALSLWRYIHCYLCTPLIHTAYARECLRIFFDWLAKDARGASLLECTWIPAEGPFRRLLNEYLAENQIPSLIDEFYTRALLAPRNSAKAYLEAVLSGERRRRLRRHEERLAEKGAVQYVRLEADGDVAVWLEEFLRLEAAGWKGREGTALQCQESDRRFFLSALMEAFRRGQLMMMALRVDGRTIALFCDLLAGEGIFVFKLTFDEAYAAFSPGALLELEKIRRIHERPNSRWADSCNAPGPSLLKDLWADRRAIETALVAPGRAPGPFVMALLPLLRWARRKATKIIGFICKCCRLRKCDPSMEKTSCQQ